MEPFRPWVDRIVYEILKNNELAKVDKVTKHALLELLGRQVLWEKKKLPFLVVSHLLAAKLKLAYHNPTLNLNWPEWIDS